MNFSLKIQGELKDNKIVRSNLYHPEGHFNEFVELVYSQFLEKKLKKFF